MADRHEKLGNLLKEYLFSSESISSGTEAAKVHVIKELYTGTETDCVKENKKPVQKKIRHEAYSQQPSSESFRQQKKKASFQQKNAAQLTKRELLIKNMPPAIKQAFFVLGLSEEADFETCRKNYKNLLMQCHPDKKQTDAEKLYAQKRTSELNEAWKLLQSWFTRL